MAKPYLEITFREGKPFAAYLYLDRRVDDSVSKTVPTGSYLIDYAQDGRILGIEIPSPTRSSVDELSALLTNLRIDFVSRAELLPLAA